MILNNPESPVYWFMQGLGFLSIIFCVYSKTQEGKKFRQWDLFGQCIALVASTYLQVYYVMLVEIIYIGIHIDKLFIRKEYN